MKKNKPLSDKDSKDALQELIALKVEFAVIQSKIKSKIKSLKKELKNAAKHTRMVRIQKK